MAGFYFPNRKYSDDEEIGQMIADVEFFENHFIQQISIAVARGMNGITDLPGIQYELEEK